ncbi:MAG: hypothetical protein ACTS73_00510 [Arsenophonus sp. NEOnobi-MAG3]
MLNGCLLDRHPSLSSINGYLPQQIIQSAICDVEIKLPKVMGDRSSNRICFSSLFLLPF